MSRGPAEPVRATVSKARLSGFSPAMNTNQASARAARTSPCSSLPAPLAVNSAPRVPRRC